MYLDWKVIIALAALALSIYNFIINKRTRATEKRTIILSELNEAQILLSRLNSVFRELEYSSRNESEETQNSILSMKDNLIDKSKEIESLYEVILNSNLPADNVQLESIRPRINNLISKTKISLERAQDFEALIKNPS